MNNNRWVEILVNGEKSLLFWAGLIILSLASIALFSVFWSFRYYMSSNVGTAFLNNVPLIIGGVVFILIGLYMMKSGIKKETPRMPFAD